MKPTELLEIELIDVATRHGLRELRAITDTHVVTITEPLLWEPNTLKVETKEWSI